MFIICLSGFGMALSAMMAVVDFMNHSFAWAVIMVAAFFLNLRTFRKACNG